MHATSLLVHFPKLLVENHHTNASIIMLQRVDVRISMSIYYIQAMHFSFMRITYYICVRTTKSDKISMSRVKRSLCS